MSPSTSVSSLRSASVGSGVGVCEHFDLRAARHASQSSCRCRATAIRDCQSALSVGLSSTRSAATDASPRVGEAGRLVAALASERAAWAQATFAAHIMATNAEAARRYRIADLLVLSEAALPHKSAAIHLAIVSRWPPVGHSQKRANRRRRPWLAVDHRLACGIAAEGRFVRYWLRAAAPAETALTASKDTHDICEKSSARNAKVRSQAKAATR
jgi:hypothetical protein